MWSSFRQYVRKWGAYAWLPLIPLLWIFLSAEGNLVVVQQMAMDTRFRVRGPIECEEKVIYVNRDEQTTASGYGGTLLAFPRQYYAKTIQALMELGGAKGVFLDFVLSNFTFSSDIFDHGALVRADSVMSQVTYDYTHTVIMAASYAGTQDRRLQTEIYLPRLVLGPRSAQHPNGYSLLDNPLPELPSYPIWSPELISASGYVPAQGRVGLINIEEDLNQGDVPRYVPLFVEVQNDLLSRHYLYGRMDWAERSAKTEEELALAKSLYPIDLTPGETDFSKMEIALVDKRQVEARQLTGENTPLEIFEIVPKAPFYTFYGAGLELYLATHPELSVEKDEHELRLITQETGQKVIHRRIPLVAKQALEINWFSSWISQTSTEKNALADPYNPKASMATVLERYDRWIEIISTGEPDDAMQAEQAEIEAWFKQFKDSVVLIGPTDVLLQDLAATPMDTNLVPKVSVHGNVYKTIASGRFIHRLPPWMEWVLTLVLTGLVTWLTMSGGAKAVTSKLLAFLILVAYVVLQFQAFSYFDLVIPMVTPLGAAISTSLFGAITQLVREQREKSRIRGMFSSYVSPKVVEKMIESEQDPQLGGHIEKITAFFSDIQGFSAFSEVLPASELVVLMNEYLNALTNILESEDGTLDKYIGDAIVAMFGAPLPTEKHAYLACRAALRMQQRQAELREEWKAQGDRWPKLVHYMQTRIGLNSGEAVIGNMGSYKRMNYTMMGDTVNVAARNESGSKYYGVYIMVSGETKVAAEAHGDDLVFRYLDKIVVKGRSEPMPIYELIGFRGQVPEKTMQCILTHAMGVEHYLRQEWDEAERLFREAAELEPNQLSKAWKIETNPSLTLIDQIAHWREEPPPPDWDGRWVMKTK